MLCAETRPHRFCGHRADVPGRPMFHLYEWLFRNKRADSMEVLRGRVEKFRDLVERNNRILGTMADAEEKLSGEYLFDIQYLRRLDAELADDVQGVVQDLSLITRKHQAALEKVFGRIRSRVAASLGEVKEVPSGPPCIPIQSLGSEDAPLAGEKMARLGELNSRLTIPVPPGFVITAPSLKPVLEHPELAPLLDAMESPFEKSVFPGTSPAQSGPA
jgi:pyruvate,water dikinase